jgi:hypothetical protein
MLHAKKPERYLPLSLLTVLYLPVLVVAVPIAVEVTRWVGGSLPWAVSLVALAVIAAYAWAFQGFDASFNRPSGDL